MSNITHDEPVSSGQARGTPAGHFYRAVWRWHFYAGLFVIPFILMLSVTGIIVMGLAFPLVGVSLAGVLLLDYIVLSRSRRLKQVLG